LENDAKIVAPESVVQGMKEILEKGSQRYGIVTKAGHKC
jgi:hypothetical protein